MPQVILEPIYVQVNEPNGESQSFRLTGCYV